MEGLTKSNRLDNMLLRAQRVPHTGGEDFKLRFAKQDTCYYPRHKVVGISIIGRYSAIDVYLSLPIRRVTHERLKYDDSGVRILQALTGEASIGGQSVAVAAVDSQPARASQHG